jgi:hypothetical protein
MIPIDHHGPHTKNLSLDLFIGSNFVYATTSITLFIALQQHPCSWYMILYIDRWYVALLRALPTPHTYNFGHGIAFWASPNLVSKCERQTTMTTQ